MALCAANWQGRKMRKLVCVCIALVFIVALQGCGALTVNPQSARKLVQEDSPPLGTVVRVELGEKMMVQKDYEAVGGETLTVTRISLYGMPHDLVGFYEITADRYYCGATVSRTIGSDGVVRRACLTEAEFKGFVPVFKTTEIIVPRAGNIQRVIEYTGRSDNRLTFSYREYN